MNGAGTGIRPIPKPEIWFADLTHTGQGISAATFPSGISYVLSYAKQDLGSEFDFKLFRFPSHLGQALREASPAMLCFSNYSWNFKLAYKFACLAKGQNPELITVFGGPNFPTDQRERLEFLRGRPGIDFYIELEGELGLVDLVQKLSECDFDPNKLKQRGECAPNTSYIIDDRLICGSTERIKDINILPSPYLSGVFEVDPIIWTGSGLS